MNVNLKQSFIFMNHNTIFRPYHECCTTFSKIELVLAEEMDFLFRLGVADLSLSLSKLPFACGPNYSMQN